MAMGVGARSWGYGADTAAGEAGRKGVSAGPQAGPRASIPARGQGRGRWRSRDFDLWKCQEWKAARTGSKPVVMRHLLCFDESPHMVFTAPLGRGSDEEVTGSRPCSMGPVREVLNPRGPSPQAGLRPPQPCSSARRSSDLNLFTEIQSPGGAWGPR